jgi:hypothetical protein
VGAKVFNFPEKAEAVRRNYHRLNLEDNPFPLHGLANRYTPFVPYPKKAIGVINAFVSDAVGSKGYHGLPLVGDYGSGKTRLLFVIEEEITEGISGCSSIYVDDPPANIKLLYEKILSKASFEDLFRGLSLKYENEITSIVQRHLERLPSLVGEEKYFVKDGGAALVRDLACHISNLTKMTACKELTEAYVLLLLDYFITKFMNTNEGMKVSLVNSIIAENGSASQYILGKKVSKKLDEALDFSVKELSATDICGDAFKLFINLNRHAGINYLFLLIDEFEEIIEKKTNREILDFLNDFRSLINSNVTSDFGIIVSCTPEAWIKTSQLSPGFSERFSSPAEMPNLDQTSALKIVGVYLESKRIKKLGEDDVSPFDKGAISAILRKSDYKIRDFIKNCNIVLAAFVASYESIIGSDFVEKTLKSNTQRLA